MDKVIQSACYKVDHIFNKDACMVPLGENGYTLKSF